MPIPLMTVSLFTMCASLLRIVLGVLLITVPLPLRDGARARIPAVLAGLLCTYVFLLVVLLAPASETSGVGFFIGQLLTFSLLLIACVGAVLFVYDTNIWTALFCCSAGYTVQNLASGATELVWTLIGGASPRSVSFNSPERFMLSSLCTVVVYIAGYLLITRYLHREGLERIEDRSMILIMAVVILVIIGFDLVIKWLVEQGIGAGAMVFLRVFHGLACCFTLTMEFELLIRRRTEAERDTLQAVISQQEHQYKQSRETIAAVNARLHDIRHNIARLGAEEGLDSSLLKDMVREISIYDTKVRTGNEALDVVLSEKRLMLEREGITLTCVADGSVLSFMASADIYTLFNEIIDRIEPSKATSISLVVRKVLGSASIHIECNGHDLEAPWPEAVRGIIHRYGGTFSAGDREGLLQFSALFPAQ